MNYQSHWCYLCPQYYKKELPVDTFRLENTRRIHKKDVIYTYLDTGRIVSWKYYNLRNVNRIFIRGVTYPHSNIKNC